MMLLVEFIDNQEARRPPQRVTIGGKRGKIALAEEVAKQAVVFVMMTLFNVTDALQTVVVGIDCLMMHMCRRQYHHWQIRGQ